MIVHAVYPGDARVRRQTDALAAAGHEIDLFCLRGPGEASEESLGALRIIRLPDTGDWLPVPGARLGWTA